jgi:hypothetical protein
MKSPAPTTATEALRFSATDVPLDFHESAFEK